MAAKTAEKVGRGPCPNCGDPVMFKRTSGGKLNFMCDADDCDSSGYAEPGSGMERKWQASIAKRSAVPLVDEIAPVPTKKAAPAPFGLENL